MKARVATILGRAVEGGSDLCQMLEMMVTNQDKAVR